MRKNWFSIIVALVAAFGATAASHAQLECYNLAYRYCCEASSLWSISCPGAPGGICYGQVHNGVDEFKQMLILPTEGAMTAASFEFVNYFYCSEYRTKTHWSWCGIDP